MTNVELKVQPLTSSYLVYSTMHSMAIVLIHASGWLLAISTTACITLEKASLTG